MSCKKKKKKKKSSELFDFVLQKDVARVANLYNASCLKDTYTQTKLELGKALHPHTNGARLNELTDSNLKSWCRRSCSQLNKSGKGFHQEL